MAVPRRKIGMGTRTRSSGIPDSIGRRGVRGAAARTSARAAGMQGGDDALDAAMRYASGYLTKTSGRNTAMRKIAAQVNKFNRGGFLSGRLLKALGPLGSAIEWLMGGIRRSDTTEAAVRDAIRVLQELAPEALEERLRPGAGGTQTSRPMRPIPVRGGSQTGRGPMPTDSPSQTGQPGRRIPGGRDRAPGDPVGGQTEIEAPPQGPADETRDPSKIFPAGLAIHMERVESSNVWSFGYDNETKTLRVQFKAAALAAKGDTVVHRGKSDSPGPLYDYLNVPADVARSMASAGSKGKAVWDLLRIRGTIHGHRYQYRLVAVGQSQVVNRQVGGRNVSFEYVPRQATQRGYETRFIDQAGRNLQSTLPQVLWRDDEEGGY